MSIGSGISKVLLLLFIPLVLSYWNSCVTLEYEYRIKICAVAESQGLLDVAEEACTLALKIAENGVFADSEISDISFRLGLLNRQQGKFETAAQAINRSLAIEDKLGNHDKTPSRLIELALDKAGLDQWLEGARILNPLVSGLTKLNSNDKKAAFSAFNLFRKRLLMRGYTKEAQQFRIGLQDSSYHHSGVMG